MAKDPAFKITFGKDFDEFRLYLAAAQGKLAPIAERAMKKATLMALTEITDRIRAGKYKRLAPLTAMLKNLEGYSNVPLIRRGALIRSISREVLSPYKGVVGVKKTGKSRGGQSLSNIAVGLHEGMRIRITDKMRRAFARKLGAMGKKVGGVSRIGGHRGASRILRIPPRPYIKAVFEDAAFIAKVEEIFWVELSKGLELTR